MYLNPNSNGEANAGTIYHTLYPFGSFAAQPNMFEFSCETKAVTLKNHGHKLKASIAPNCGGIPDSISEFCSVGSKSS